MDFPSPERCAELNRSASFIPASDPDGEGQTGPAVMVAGVLACVYLDPEDGVLRVSMHFDSAFDEILVDNGDGVPVEFVMGDGRVAWSSHDNPTSRSRRKD